MTDQWLPNTPQPNEDTMHNTPVPPSETPPAAQAPGSVSSMPPESPAYIPAEQAPQYQQPTAMPYTPPQPVPPPYIPPAQAQQGVPPYGQQPPAPPYGMYPPYGAYPPAFVPPPKAEGLAVASLVLGIVGLVFSAAFGAVPALLGLIFGIISRAKGNTSAKSVVGIVLSAVALVLSGLVIAMIVSEWGTYHYYGSNYYDNDWMLACLTLFQR